VGPDGTIYVGSDDKHLYAIKPDGTRKWAFKTGGSIVSSPAVGSDGTIYVGSGDGKVYAVNRDGSLKWTFQTGDVVYSSPLVGPDGTIYVASWDRYVYAIDPEGRLEWTFETGNGIFSSPAMGSDGAIYIGSSDGKLYAIRPGEKGEPKIVEPMAGEAATQAADAGLSVREASSEAVAISDSEKEGTPDTVETGSHECATEGSSDKGSPGQEPAVKEEGVPAVAQEEFREIRNVRFEVEDDGEERVVFLLNGIFAPKILTVTQAWPRVICDFAGARLARGLEGETRVHSALIQRIRASSYGPSGFGVKVVLDMHPDATVPLENRFFDEEYVYASEEEYLYMLIFQPDGEGPKDEADEGTESMEGQK
jgi:hypothetical protein